MNVTTWQRVCVPLIPIRCTLRRRRSALARRMPPVATCERAEWLRSWRWLVESRSTLAGSQLLPHDLSFREPYLCFTKATTLPAESWRGPFIPQYLYRPHTSSNRKRYVEEVTLSNPLYFVIARLLNLASLF
ncbi:hypothetical protein BKA70DRAFT_1301127 [Coprinopsis sp. MPI-PUGE-AT-0042]|nr:hypothetical protein BKA70DRAFT_1301127 [Coprinopsis sp. MPI-PUGE-AT-0042]